MTATPHHSQLIKRSRIYTRMAYILLLWETYAPALAITLAALTIFIILSFGGVWERIGDPWRLIALCGLIYLFVRSCFLCRKISRPSYSHAQRRVEADSHLHHRPLDTLHDRPISNQALWSTHYKNTCQKLDALSPPKIKAVLSPLDPYYLRFILPACVGLAAMVGVGDNFERLQRALTPIWQTGISSDDMSFEVWVTPPDYTGRPPLYVNNQRQIKVPVGSELVARISGAPSATRLKIISQNKTRYLPLNRLGPQSFESRTRVNDKILARWRVGNLKKSWSITALPDRPPTINFDVQPRADKRDRLAFTYSLNDDYGVENLELVMQLVTDNPNEAHQQERVPIALSRASLRTAEFENVALDLTKHHWAGRRVSAYLEVKDGLGQTAQSATTYFRVPDKVFVEPLAKAVMEHRALVLKGQQSAYAYPPTISYKEWSKLPLFDTYQSSNRMDRAHPSIQKAAHLIEAVTDSPSGLFYDPAVYIGLKHVENRLRYARSLHDLQGIPEDLWGIALRAEYGILGTALENMIRAEAALQEGMARRAPQREIDTLFERYNDAVDRYIEELRRKAIEEDNFADTNGMSGDGQNRNVDQIQELLEAIEEANRLGDTEGARKALAQLAELLRNMQIQLSRSGGGSGSGLSSDGEMSEELQDSLEELADLLGEQRELMNETEQAENQQNRDSGAEDPFDDGTESQTGQGGADNDNDNGAQSQDQHKEGGQTLSPEELARQQEGLERALQDFSELIQSIPEDERSAELGGDGQDEADSDENNQGGNSDENGTEQALMEAENAMERAQNFLRSEDLTEASEAQQEAIKALRRAGRALAERARNTEQNGASPNGSVNNENDPLGRQNGTANNDNSQADLEQKDDATRSRELLEELRRRAGEQERDSYEREYYERLLDQF